MLPVLIPHLGAAGGITPRFAATPGLSIVKYPSGGGTLGGSSRTFQTLGIVTTGGLSQSGNISVHDLSFHIYCNNGQSGPVDYTTPVATVVGSDWTEAGLHVPGHYKYGVRAFNLSSLMEEQNIDALIELILDGQGNDATAVPLPCAGLRAFELPGNRFRIEWSHPYTGLIRKPDGFRVYLGRGPSPDFSVPFATVPSSKGMASFYSLDLPGLDRNVAYSICVRAFSAAGEDLRGNVVTIAMDNIPPSAVDSLAAAATSQES